MKAHRIQFIWDTFRTISVILLFTIAVKYDFKEINLLAYYSDSNEQLYYSHNNFNI